MKADDLVTFSVPREVLAGIVQLPEELLERLHVMLERNADGKLGAAELEELRRLVNLVEFSQIVSTALRGPSRS